jgi:hypothetical protein
MSQGSRKFEIGRILHLKSEILDWTDTITAVAVQFAISDFGFEMQDSSNFKFPLPVSILMLQDVDTLLKGEYSPHEIRIGVRPFLLAAYVRLQRVHQSSSTAVRQQYALGIGLRNRTGDCDFIGHTGAPQNGDSGNMPRTHLRR